MKKVLCSLAILLVAFCSQAQDKDIAPAAKGVVYGTIAPAQTTAVSADEIENKITGAEYSGRITGKVTEVCQAMGCWFKLQKADGTSLVVKTKDHSFFLPQNLVGKTVTVDGTAKIKEVTEAQRKHFAEDGGKSKEEIEKIKGSEKQVQVVAAGVQVMN
jgi:hypothetical protein